MKNMNGSPLGPSSSHGAVTPSLNEQTNGNRLPLTYRSLTCDTDSSNIEVVCEIVPPSAPTTKVAPSETRRFSTPRNNIAVIVPRGYKLRDEFVCPITRELIVDPVIAADGHT